MRPETGMRIGEHDMKVIRRFCTKEKMRYLFCILAALLFFLLMLSKDVVYEEYIASDNGGSVELSSGVELTQSWLSNQKKICGINLVFAQRPEAEGKIALQVIDKESGSVVRSAEEELSKISDNVLRLSFGTLKIETTEQFIFQIVFKPADNLTSGSILLKANDNYGGLSLDGKEQGCGLGSSVLYIKSNPLFTMISFVGSILILALCLMQILRREFADVLGVVIIAISLCLYVCGLAFNIEIGVKIIWILAVLGFFFLLYNIAVGKLQIGKLFSFTVLAVLSFYVFSVVYNYNTIITESDEFYHWALTVKDMFYSKHLAFHDGSAVVYTRYPPFMSLIQDYFMCINGAFSVRLLYIAYQFSGFCFLIVCMGRNLVSRKISIYQKMIVAVILAFFPLILYPRYYNLIMIDGFLGVLFAYVLYCFFFGELDRFNVVRIAMGLWALVLTKEMGVVLAGLACAVFIVCKFIEKGRAGLKDVIRIVVMGLTALAVFIGWQLYCQLNISYAMNRYIASAAGMIDNGTGNLEVNRIKYILSVFYKGIFRIFNDIKVGPFYYVLFMVCLVFAAYCMKCFKKQRGYLVAAVTLAIGNVVYFVCMMMLYVLVFSSNEALTAASLDRYLFSYLLGMIYLAVCCCLDMGPRVLGLLLCIVLYFAPMEAVLTLNQTVDKKQALIWGYDEIDANIRSFAEKDDKIYYWCDDSMQMSYRIFRFYICPLLPQDIVDNCTFRYTGAEGKKQTYDLDRIQTILAGYDYVYIANYDEEAKAEYLNVFYDGEDMMSGGIYRVDTGEDGVRLRYIGYSPIRCFY